MVIRKVLDLLRSRGLALALMLAILVAIFVGTALLPPPAGHRLVFRALWFNGLLVLLVVNTACCFFSRIRPRRWNAVLAGMVIFHLSFVGLFAGVVVNSLFSLKGSLRLTEGETIPLDDPAAFDRVDRGRFFDGGRLRGEASLHKLHTGYMVGKVNKGVADEISVSSGGIHARGIIYPTHHLSCNGLRFLRDKDGFAPLFVLYDREGRELYGGYVPLQSFEVKKGTFLYTTGTKELGAASMAFPAAPNVTPNLAVRFTYNLPKFTHETPTATYKVWQYDGGKESGEGRFLYEGTAPLGETVRFGDYALAMKEVRYWASMDVVYAPGQPIVFFSFWAGLAGIALTTIARIFGKTNGRGVTGGI